MNKKIALKGEALIMLVLSGAIKLLKFYLIFSLYYKIL
mgnify:CR=1 FL=1